MKKIINKQLGELLIDSKLITPAQLEEALKAQKEKGGLIGQILVVLGYTTEDAIAQALTAQYGFPYLPLSGYEIDTEACAVVPERVAQQYGLVPVDRVGNVLTIAMSNPLNQQAIEDVEMITHMKVQVFVTRASDVIEAIKRLYHKS